MALIPGKIKDEVVILGNHNDGKLLLQSQFPPLTN